MYNRIFFENDAGDVLCASHSMDVFILNDIIDYQPVISNLFIRSVNLPYDTYVSSSLIHYSNLTNQLSFTLQDNAIRQVVDQFCLSDSCWISSLPSLSTSLLWIKFHHSLALFLCISMITIILLLLWILSLNCHCFHRSIHH